MVRQNKVCVLILLLTALTALSAIAENLDVQIKVTTDASGKIVATGMTDGQEVDVQGKDAALTITCDGVICDPINITLKGAPLPLKSTSAQTKTVTVPASSLGTVVQNAVVRKGANSEDRLLGFKLKNTSVASGGSGSTGQSTACIPKPLGQTYFEEEDLAHFVVTPGGSILEAPDGPVDENDIVVVHVFGPDTVVDQIEVARTSPTRSIAALSAIGADVTTNFSNFSSVKLNCVERKFTLGDFAPGDGTVEMYTIANGTKTRLGSFTFKVNKLYDGILSFGPAWTPEIGDATFKLAPNGSDKIIVASEEKKRNVIYTVAYTYYAWGRRDLEKTYPPHMHINPTIAVSINGLRDHALAGVTYDFGQILVTVGYHLAHVNRLSAASGLAPGSKFTGTDADIPQSKRWEGNPYIGVTVDLRAAAALLKALGK